MSSDSAQSGKNPPDSQSVYSSVVAVTGTIGSGKSTATALLKKFGASVVSADELARRAVQAGSPGLAQVAAEFGNQILTNDGNLDRRKAAEIVFSHPEKHRALERITHPIVSALAQKEFTDLASRKAKLIVYDCPLFFEAGLDALPFRKKVLISADEEKIRTRLLCRDNIDAAAVKRRIAAQMPDVEKRARADIVIENNGTIQELEEKISDLYRTLTV